MNFETYASLLPSCAIPKGYRIVFQQSIVSLWEKPNFPTKQKNFQYFHPEKHKKRDWCWFCQSQNMRWSRKALESTQLSTILYQYVLTHQASTVYPQLVNELLPNKVGERYQSLCWIRDCHHLRTTPSRLQRWAYARIFFVRSLQPSSIATSWPVIVFAQLILECCSHLTWLVDRLMIGRLVDVTMSVKTINSSKSLSLNSYHHIMNHNSISKPKPFWYMLVL